MTSEVEAASARKLLEVSRQRQDFRDGDKNLRAVINIHLLAKSLERNQTACIILLHPNKQKGGTKHMPTIGCYMHPSSPCAPAKFECYTSYICL